VPVVEFVVRADARHTIDSPPEIRMKSKPSRTRSSEAPSKDKLRVDPQPTVDQKRRKVGVELDPSLLKRIAGGSPNNGWK